MRLKLKTHHLVFLYIFCTLTTACSNEKKAETKKPLDVIKIANYPPDSALFKKIDKYFRKKYKQRSFSGNIIVSKKGEILYRESMGYRNVRAKEKLDINSTFELASVSKPITAMAILLLAQEGKIDLNDSINKYLHGFPYLGIKIKHLLSHRGGLSNYMYFADDHWDKKKVKFITNKDVVNLYKVHVPRPYYLPNRRYNYSNTGYCLLASIIEKASGKRFHDYLDDHIFNPLGMNNSFVYDTIINKGDSSIYTFGHEKNNRKVKLSYLNGVVGDKGVYSTIDDMFLFDQALFNYKLIDSANLVSAFKPQHKDLYKWDNYGYGWRLDVKNPNNRIVYHTGWWNGYRTYYIRKLDKDASIIVLNNTTRGAFLKLKDLLQLI